MRRRLSLVLAGLGLWLLLSPGAVGDLLTYGYSTSRTGTDPRSPLSVASAERLRVAWSRRVDGAINAQPIVVHGVRMHRRTLTLVLAVTEHGQVVALSARTGRTVWRRRVGERRLRPDCRASPDGIFGVTGTPVVDRRAGRVYLVGVDGRTWAFGLRDGHVVPGWPVRVTRAPADFVWGGLALRAGWLYVPIASLCDSGRYAGGIMAIRTGHPRRIRRWLTTAGTPAYGGGVWGWGGVSIDPVTGRVYAATGNSLGTFNEATGHAESVVELGPKLILRQANNPLRGPFRTSDRDFGTTPVLVHRAGCPRELVAINKDGELFLYDRARISSGPRQRLRVAGDPPGGIPLLGVPAFDPASSTLVLVSPSSPRSSPLRRGIQAYTLTRSCRLVLDWQRDFDPPDAGSGPTIAGKVLFLGSGRNGWVRAFRLRDGAAINSWHLSTGAIFAAPAVDGDSLYVGSWSGRIWALRPAR